MRAPALLSTAAALVALVAACSGGGGAGKGTGGDAGAGTGGDGGVMSEAGGARACGSDCAGLPHVASGATCDAGACVFTCMPGWAHCTQNPGDGCETDLSQPASCGACANVCPTTAPVCLPEGAGYACSTACFNGTPTLCDGVCTDTTTDPKNCGGCGNACPPASSCMGGKCT